MAPEHIPSLRGRATITTVIIVVVLIALCLIVWMYRNTPPLSNFLGSGVGTSQIVEPDNTVAYSCDQGKTLVAKYYTGTPSTAANGMPIPGGKVVLTLTDSSVQTLNQTVSADGTRYANSEESFIFWSKGNTAFVMEGTTQAQTYAGCIRIAQKTADQQMWQVFASSKLGFSVLYPQNYTLDTAYKYQALGPGKDINGVKFTIPAALASGTNLSTDSYVSVEEIPNIPSCSAALFLDGAKALEVTADGTRYSVAQQGGAGAGNLYDETVFAVPGTSPCTAVRYFIHSTQLANYPAGTRTEFDRAALVAQFDEVRRSLILGR